MQPQLSASTVKSDQPRVTTAIWIKRLGAVMLIGLIMALGLIVPQLVQAESDTASPSALVVVNTATDENDGSCGDGDCSLRDAIAVAANDDTITFSGSYTIYLNSKLSITKTLTIDGSGHTIKVSGDSGGNGSPNVQVFFIGGSTVTLTHLNIISGTDTYGGGIINWGTLTLQNSTLSGNTAYEGGGTYNHGTLTLQNSTFSGNSALAYGGGIVNVATLNIQNSTFANNSAVTYEGGGIDNLGALTLQNSTLSGNSAGDFGGGIYNDGTAIIRNSTFYDNSSDLYGGGISNNDTLTVQNSTLAGNSAYIYGGGIYNRATLNLSNTLIANNDWQDCANDLGGTVGTNDHNLIEGAGSSACGLVNGVNGNLIGVDPLLAPSSNYGGSTQTAALLPGSPAIDAGNACLTTDQRGVARPQVAACDIGAFESQGFNLTVTGGSGQSTPVHLAFSDPLSLIVGNSFDEPVDGGQVIVTGPSNGAGINPPIYTATISSGAVTQLVRANGTSGSYSVAADTRGRLGSAASFNLTNLALKTVMLGNGLVITDGDTTPSLADHTDFGNVTPGWAITRTFTVSNNSDTASSIVYSLGLSGAGAGNFALSGPVLPVTLTANSAITFQVRFTPAIFATSTATITLATDDGPENDYDFSIQGTGVCANPMSVTNANDSGAGSLRHALDQICAGGTIDFAADTTLYLNSQLEITKTLTIDGSGHTIKLSGDSLGDGIPNVRVLSIGSSGVVTLTHLAIISGTANSEVNGYEGGGIRNTGRLTLQNSTLAGNAATNYGGGLYNSGTLLVSDSTFSRNSTDFAGAGIYNSSGRITVTNSTLSGNLAEWGGGLYNASGTLTVQHSTFSRNSASNGVGGGICNGGTLTVQDSTLSDNAGGNGGGGVYNSGMLTVQNSTFSGNSTFVYGGGISNDGTSTIQNSTFSGNSGDYGGGIFSGNTLTLQNSTLSGNSASQGGGVYHNSGTLSLLNTLIGNSPSGGDCRNGSGTLSINDHNLLQSTLITDTCGLTNGAGGSLIGVDPLLGPLANNGGNTQTFALLSGSPALNAGNNATCLPTDQRGVARPQSVACDVGAYEFARLSLAKWVTPAAHVLDHNTVTYTLVLGLGQGEVAIDPHIVLTDVLPSQVLFGSWVISPANTVRSGNAITWTGALAAGDAITFTFTATYLGSSSKWVTNTAMFSGTTWAGSAAAGFQVAHVITPTAGAGGSITPGTSQIVDHGENRTFTIAPDAGYHLLDVGVDGVSVGALSVYTFTNVIADHTISATFDLNEYTLTAGAVGQGQVTRTPDQATYLHGSIVTLTAIPQTGWHFGQWLGEASGTLTQTTVLMDANKVVTATFLNTPSTYYTLTLGMIGSGVITPTVGAHAYLSGTVVPLSASPEVGWRFMGWSGNADCANGSVTLNANKLCTATFARYQVYLPLILQ